MYFSTNDAIYFGVVCVLATGGFIANAFLLYMIIYRSPKHLSPYRILLANTALTQLLLAAVIFITSPRALNSSLLMAILLSTSSLKRLLLVANVWPRNSRYFKQRILTEGFNISNIYLGPSQLLGPWCSYMLYVSMLHLTLNSFMSLMVSMIYRCISLRISKISTCGALQMCLAGYAIPFSMVASAVNMEYTASTAKAAEITHYMVPNIDKYSVVVSANVLQPCLLWIMFCCSLLLIPIYATMYICRWKILSFIEKATSVQSSFTKLNTQRLVKALTVQSLVPTLSIFPPAIAYLLIQFGILGPQLFSYFIVPCISIGPLIDPIITIHYVSPYRHFVSSTILSQYRGSNYSYSNQMRSQASKAGNSPSKSLNNMTVPV